MQTRRLAPPAEHARKKAGANFSAPALEGCCAKAHSALFQYSTRHYCKKHASCISLIVGNVASRLGNTSFNEVSISLAAVPIAVPIIVIRFDISTADRVNIATKHGNFHGRQLFQCRQSGLPLKRPVTHANTVQSAANAQDRINLTRPNIFHNYCPASGLNKRWLIEPSDSLINSNTPCLPLYSPGIFSMSRTTPSPPVSLLSCPASWKPFTLSGKA